jgi:KTSC domain
VLRLAGSQDLRLHRCHQKQLHQPPCYDKAKQFIAVQLKDTYYTYCEMPAATYDAFLNASSMGQYYNANIKGWRKDGPFDCRTHAKPAY